jgi:AP-4 complex subunit sigma-1
MRGLLLLASLRLTTSVCRLVSLRSNKMGQTRFSSYYEWISMDERTALESEIIRKCLSRSETQCSFLEYRGYKVIYRRYASLFFIVGTKTDMKGTENTENELGMLEFIHTLVECMVRHESQLVQHRTSLA